jgi:hypothetical protein
MDSVTQHNQDLERREQEAERYRAAADQALDQLRWVINYLYRIRKDRLAEGLERNRARILKEGRLDP